MKDKFLLQMFLCCIDQCFPQMVAGSPACLIEGHIEIIRVFHFIFLFVNYMGIFLFHLQRITDDVNCF